MRGKDGARRGSEAELTHTLLQPPSSAWGAPFPSHSSSLQGEGWHGGEPEESHALAEGYCEEGSKAPEQRTEAVKGKG